MMAVLFPTFMVHTLQNDVVVRNTFSVCIFVAQTERLISQCRWTVLKEQKASYKECIVLSQELGFRVLFIPEMQPCRSYSNSFADTYCGLLHHGDHTFVGLLLSIEKCHIW